jgi:hypothetical protein
LQNQSFRSILNPILLNSNPNQRASQGTLIVSPFDLSQEAFAQTMTKATFPWICFCPMLLDASSLGESHATLMPPEYFAMELTLQNTPKHRKDSKFSLVVFEGAIGVDVLRSRLLDDDDDGTAATARGKQKKGKEVLVKVKSATTPGTANIVVRAVGERAVAGNLGRLLVDFDWVCRQIDWQYIGLE